MSANLFLLNNLIAKNLVTAARTTAPINAVIYTATPGNLIYIHDDFASLEVAQLALHNNELVAVCTEGFQYDVHTDDIKTTVNACSAEQFYNPVAYEAYLQRQAA